MALHIKTPSTNSTVSVSSIPNVVDGPLGLIPQNVSGGDTDRGFYQVDSPWSVNLNGQLYNTLYVSSKSFLSFGTAAVDGSPTTPTSNKILLGNRKNTSVPDTYSKNFYYAVSGNIGNRTLRMRYEGGFKVSPTNTTSSSITNTILGRASLDQYNFTGTPAYVELILPWNANFYTTTGTIQNVVRVYSDSYIAFGKHDIANASTNFSANGNQLLIGTYTGGFVGVGTGLWSGIEGSSPNRRYRIRYEGYNDALIGKPVTAWEVIFYENNKDIIEVQTATTPDYFSLDSNGWSNNYGSSTILDLTNTSGNYNNKGTRLSQDPQNTQGFLWTLRTGGTNISDFTYGNGLYVAVGSATNTSILRTSTDAIVWVSRTSGFGTVSTPVPITGGSITNYEIYGVGYGNGTFVACGQNKTVTSSVDGITWTLRTSNASAFTGLSDVEYMNGIFIMWSNLTLETSPNGIVWTSRNHRPGYDSVEIATVAYGNGIYVYSADSTGNGGLASFIPVLGTSTDLNTWSLRTSDFSFNKIIFVNNLFVGVSEVRSGVSPPPNGGETNIAVSTNGIFWTFRTSGLSTSDRYFGLNDIVYAENRYTAVGTTLDGSVRNVIYSTDTINWTKDQSPPVSPGIIIFGNNQYLINGFATGLFYTKNFEWEATLYENDTNRIDVQLGSLISPTLNNNDYYFGVYSSDTSLYQFPTISNAGYQITSTYTTPAWATIQNVYAKVTSNWQTVRNLYVRDSGLWKLVHPNTNGPVYFFCKRSTYENDIYGNKGGTGIASFQNDTFIVPDGVTTITVELWGGGGSAGTITGFNTGSLGGGGGYVKATLSVTPGETLIVRVGGGGWQYAANVLQHPTQPLTGGTVSVVSRRSDVLSTNQAINGTIGGSGGGYSAIFRGSTPLLVAGGGGGGGSSLLDGTISFGGNGGAGGGNIGQAGVDGDSKQAFTPPYPARGGGGGTQISGGSGGASGQTNRAICAGLPGENGSYLQGGRGTNSPELQTTNLVTHGTASNPGTNGGAAGGGSSRTGATVCYDGAGTTQYAANTLYAVKACGGGGGGGYYGGGGGGCGFDYIPLDTIGTGGGGGGGGSNYVGGALSVILNSQGNLRTPGNTSSPYYLTSYLYAPSGGVSGVPFNAFAQGGAGYGGNRVAAGPIGDTNIRYGNRGENGLVVIYW